MHGFASVLTRAQSGLDAPLVNVEVSLSGGLPGFAIVGLPATAVRESRDRVRAALERTGLGFPDGKVVCNLSPADLPKEGGRYDLAIAAGIAIANDRLATALAERVELFGELGLDGRLRPFRGALPAALAVRAAGRQMIVPSGNAAEAALAHDSGVLPADTLVEVGEHLDGSVPIAPLPGAGCRPKPAACPDLADVRAQFGARRALEIAAAGAHSLLMTGPPGTGKTMLAARLPGLLPPLSHDEAIETAAVHSLAAAGFDPDRWRQRPFRSPHHTASPVALVGGGAGVQPGEISLAHNGVLFLDELPEFDRRVLEVLRQPLEDGRVLISRAARKTEYPARFQLVAAMNPCPCGFRGDRAGDCRCPPGRVAAYRARVSGPLLDRFDLAIDVPRPPRTALDPSTAPGEPSASVAARVQAARHRQHNRGAASNAALSQDECVRYCLPDSAGRRLVETAVDRLRLSARGYYRVLRVARTIADLTDAETPGERHVAEALSLRLDATAW